MLKKLMKYEFKATSRLLVPLYLILFVMSIINRFVFNMNNHTGVVGIINQFFVTIYIGSIFVVLIATVLYMIIRFYKNLLTDEGYLMFTLPTKTHQLITSKLITTVLWAVFSIIAVLISLFIAFSTPDIFPAILNGIKEAIANLNGEFGGNWILLVTELIIMFLLGLVSNILLIYVSIATGQLFTKHKIVGAFASYAIIYTVLQFLMVVVFIPLGVFTSKNQLDTSSLPQVIFPIVIVILTLGSACFYIATNYIFKKKLNLD